MSHRTTRIILAGAAAAALALPAGAQASQGADDPPGHVRHGSHQTAQTSAAHNHRHRGRHRGRHSSRNRVDDSRNRVRGVDDNSARGGGADDNTARHGGADDGPNHT
jgi:hypothetical protein